MSELTRARFQDYLEQRWSSIVRGEGNVPCGACRGCCRAGYTIGLSQDEAARIPHSLIEGHAVILPLPNGDCPFLVEGNCSIYLQRPTSCRQFDCRDFAMSSVMITEVNQPAGVAEINSSVKRFIADNGGLTPNEVASQAHELIRQGYSAVLAAQGAIVTTMLHHLPAKKARRLMRVVTSPEAQERAAADRAAKP